jgi:NAD+ kinase
VAPHGVFNRTLAVHPDEQLQVEVVEESANVRLDVDGQTHAELPPGAQVRVARSAQPGLVVRLGQTNFYERARTKLRLGDPPLLLP